jgi:paraquat-inducible protein B
MLHIGRMIGFGVMVAMVLAMTSDGVFAQKKKKDADADPKNSAATEADYAKLTATMFPAKLITLESGKSVTVRVEYKKKEANPDYKPPVTTPGQPGYNATAANLQKKLNDLQAQLQKAPTPKVQAKINADMAAINVQLAKLNNDPKNQKEILVSYTKDYDFDFEKKVVYRKMSLPTDKEYTAEDKLTLRGTESPPLPGYIAKADDLEEGQEVKLYFNLPKKKGKADDGPVEHATVKMIVVTKKAGYETETPKKK